LRFHALRRSPLRRLLSDYGYCYPKCYHYPQPIARPRCHRPLARRSRSSSSRSLRVASTPSTLKGSLRGRTKPHSRTLNKIARGLGVSPDDFSDDLTVEGERRARLAGNTFHCRVDQLMSNGIANYLWDASIYSIGDRTAESRQVPSPSPNREVACANTLGSVESHP